MIKERANSTQINALKIDYSCYMNGIRSTYFKFIPIQYFSKQLLIRKRVREFIFHHFQICDDMNIFVNSFFNITNCEWINVFQLTEGVSISMTVAKNSGVFNHKKTEICKKKMNPCVTSLQVRMSPKTKNSTNFKY